MSSSPHDCSVVLMIERRTKGGLRLGVRDGVIYNEKVAACIGPCLYVHEPRARVSFRTPYTGCIRFVLIISVILRSYYLAWDTALMSIDTVPQHEFEFGPVLLRFPAGSCHVWFHGE